MVIRNPHFAKLQAGYLFPEINKRKKAYLEKFPDASLISLGIGDTTEPLPGVIADALASYAKNLGTLAGYHGYGMEQGQLTLREKLAEKVYSNKISADEVFISDGSKCDIGRLQLLFGSQTSIAVQNPSYPAYVDTAVMMGQTDHFDSTIQGYKNIRYLDCLPENDFFPDLNQTPKSDLIYFCSPNNPTGTAASYSQLKELVNWARINQSIIIYDAAYSFFIQDPTVPKSIYEIEGAQDVAIELGSFSKMVGFTGVRLGWSIVPKSLKYENGSSVHADWLRLISTFFNGASNIAQAGGIAALSDEGFKAIKTVTDYYMQNTRELKNTLNAFNLLVYGGVHAPYLWVKLPFKSSWDAFDALLNQTQIIATPGSGFGSAGESFLRFSAFGSQSSIKQAIERLIPFFHSLKSSSCKSNI